MAEGALQRAPQGLLDRLSRLEQALPEPSGADAPLLHRVGRQSIPSDADTSPSPAEGKAEGLLEYEVDGGARVRYKRGPDDEVLVLVVYAGSAPPDTH